MLIIGLNVPKEQQAKLNFKLLLATDEDTLIAFLPTDLICLLIQRKLQRQQSIFTTRPVLLVTLDEYGNEYPEAFLAELKKKIGPLSSEIGLLYAGLGCRNRQEESEEDGEWGEFTSLKTYFLTD